MLQLKTAVSISYIYKPEARFFTTPSIDASFSKRDLMSHGKQFDLMEWIHLFKTGVVTGVKKK